MTNRHNEDTAAAHALYTAGITAQVDGWHSSAAEHFKRAAEILMPGIAGQAETKLHRRADQTEQLAAVADHHA